MVYDVFNHCVLCAVRLKSTMRRSSLCAFMLILLLCFNWTVAAYGDEAGAGSAAVSTNALPKDFLSLADLRATTQADVVKLSQEIADLENEIPRAEFEEVEVANTNAEIAELEKKENKTPPELSRLEKLRFEVSFRARGSGSPASLKKRLEEKRVLLLQTQDAARRIQAEISKLLSPDQDFRKTMSITFAGLIGCVILGFFIVSLRDDKIRQAIFSGEAGIQFLTLFSLVIAIILFGITQILEGKELAALLGGLSGYILGRSTSRPAAKQDGT